MKTVHASVTLELVVDIPDGLDPGYVSELITFAINCGDTTKGVMKVHSAEMENFQVLDVEDAADA